MAFIETPRFPVTVNYGSMGGPTYKTDIVTYGNGSEYRNAVWSLPLYKYDFRIANLRRSDINNVYEFFLSLQGMADGFRVKDFHDFTSASDGVSAHAATDVQIGVGDGSDTTFQLIKIYTKGTATLNRTIKKPVTSTVLIEVNSVAQTEGVDFTVDYTTGIVTFTSPPTNTHVITAGFEFDVPVRIDKDDMSDIMYGLYTAATTDVVSIGNVPMMELRNP